MTQTQIQSILTNLNLEENSIIDFNNTNLSYINISKFENKKIDPKELQFYFDGTNQLLEVIPCKVEENKPIKYLLDSNGNKVSDIYSYEAIQEFNFNGITE